MFSMLNIYIQKVQFPKKTGLSKFKDVNRKFKQKMSMKLFELYICTLFKL